MTTFGGHPVEIVKVNHQVLVKCKGVTGTMEQLKRWYDNHQNTFESFYFGFGDKLSKIKHDGDMVQIACLKENYFSFKNKIKSLINGKNSSVSGQRQCNS